MKERYDKKARPHGYSVGQYCFLHIPSLLTPHTSKKMQSRFSGPYIITQFTSPVTCMLVRCRDGKLTKKSVHVHRLKCPSVKDRSFIKRLDNGPLGNLLDPDVIIDTHLSPADRAIIHFHKGSRKPIISCSKRPIHGTKAGNVVKYNRKVKAVRIREQVANS